MEKKIANCSVQELTKTEAAQINGGGTCCEWLGKVVGGIVGVIQSIQVGTAEGGYAACKVGPIP
ncbi:MAG: hypothetical protein PHT07_18150 [Paludibacter sp.]|nr:hypothetical protein [Paludibacter sp.]